MFQWFRPMRFEQVHNPLVYSIFKFNRTVSYAFAIHAQFAKKRHSEVLKCQSRSLILPIVPQKLETVDQFTYISKDRDQSILVRMCWDELPSERDWTRHNIAEIFEDVPDMPGAYLDKISSRHN